MPVSVPRPVPESDNRQNDAEDRRNEATQIAKNYSNPLTQMNNDENDLEGDGYALSFTKGLYHGDDGILDNNAHYSTLVEAINQDAPTDFAQVQRGITGSREPKTRLSGDAFPADQVGKLPSWRGWESPRAGHYGSLEGPDSDAVSMPPAPALGSIELDAEMAEVYALALLRDNTFAEIADSSGIDTLSGIAVDDVINALQNLEWYDNTSPVTGLSLQERRRRVARFASHAEHDVDNPPDITPFERKHLFRGSAPGALLGPYVSQFMLQGTRMRIDDADDNVFTDASLVYGSQEIDQKVSFFPAGVDYMVHWNAYLDVQNGADFGGANRRSHLPRRFIDTPRDLATYVRFDQLYQAYLNACLFMLESKPFTPQQPVAGTGFGFPDRSPSDNRQAFAMFGGPHVLSMVTEVATRCLKAVRRQKYNYHRRARPERLAALLTRHAGALPGFADFEPAAQGKLNASSANLNSMLTLVAQHNQSRREDLSEGDDRPDRADGVDALQRSNADPHLLNDLAPLDPIGWDNSKNFLLPMAFAEGSPMHPSYGAGHATVAGGCVTMLKAFFHTVDDAGKPVPWPKDLPIVQVQSGSDGQKLENIRESIPNLDTNPITIAGELNKLAANISIGRDMAGVHFYTDYYESLRMGERISTGILLEQLTQYDEAVEFSFHSFDGDLVHLYKSGGGSVVKRKITDSQGRDVDFDTWWTRHVSSLAQANRIIAA